MEDRRGKYYLKGVCVLTNQQCDYNLKGACGICKYRPVRETQKIIDIQQIANGEISLGNLEELCETH